MKNGFTLIELMVVIVILGILSSLVAPRIPKFFNKAKEGRTKGNLASLRSAVNIYYADSEGNYPKGTAGDEVMACLVPRYLKTIPIAEMPPHHPAQGGSRLGSEGDVNDDGGWWYQNIESLVNWGEVIINCDAHTDYSGIAWSSY